jgi:hypothetical protein
MECCKKAKPAKNNPAIMMNNLITFFNAQPMSIPVRNPPPIVVTIGLKLSVTIPITYPRGYINVFIIHVVFI